MKKSGLPAFVVFIIFCCLSVTSYAQPTEDVVTTEALHLLHRMSLKEKIGQKLMLSFRYWCAPKQEGNQPCLQGLTSLNPAIKEIVSKNHIGGIILFSNNLKDVAQITTLTDSFQKTMQDTSNLPLLIGTDEEGGIFTRLPRDISANFPGNMAITAAYLGNQNKNYSAAVGKMIALDLKVVGINVDFAPDVDVNSNPLNPIVHVRSFSDNPQLVSMLGLEFSEAIQKEGIGSTLKHFPGHGDTITDSHLGLPLVNHTIEQAWAIDLFPFKNIIEKNPPDLIMTAHIQYPALDNSTIYAGKIDKEITTPATLSREIQYELLRKQLGYQGVIITDALNMDAIAQNFDPIDAIIKAFQAGDDLALMPLTVSQPEDADSLADMILKVEAAVQKGALSLNELDQSVLRILKLKIKLGLLQPETMSLPEKIAHAQKVFSAKDQRDLEASLANDAMTLVQNNDELLPINPLPHTRIHIITPWLEQGAGIAAEIRRLQKKRLLPQDLEVSFAKMADTDLATEIKTIEKADILITGNIATIAAPLSNHKAVRLSEGPIPLQGLLLFPDMLIGDSEKSSNSFQFFKLLSKTSLPDDQFAFEAMKYAKAHHKKVIFISLLAPYDLPNYAKVSDAMLVGYDYYGYLTDQTHGYYRGPSMPALTRMIFGFSHAKAKLPANIPNPSNTREIVYPRGYGLNS